MNSSKEDVGASINRIRLEFKGMPPMMNITTWQTVLIESDWNLKDVI